MSEEVSEGADVRGLRATVTLRDVELDALVLLQVAETLAADGGEVREEVGASIVGGDEAEALVAVEPLDGYR